MACCAAATVEAREREPWITEIEWPPTAQQYELWAGADATRAYWSAWSGMTMAPFGAVTRDGLRLRTVTGGGVYRYRSHVLIKGRPQPAEFKALGAFAEGLAGWHAQLGRLTLKPFAGIAMQERWLSPLDPLPELAGRSTGLKLALESWLAIRPAVWASLDGSWSAARDTYWSRGRVGWRVLDDLSLGLEAGAQGDRSKDSLRAGGLVRYAWPGGEVWLAGGLAREGLGLAARETDAGYLSGNALIRW